MVKNNLRKSLLKQGLALSNTFIESSSKTIQLKFIDYLHDQKVKSILLYSPFRQEIKLDLIFKSMKDGLVDIYLPKVLPNKKLKFNLYTRNTNLVKNRYGILESVSKKFININDIQLLVIPFLGVDKKGARLGYGSGYYDRAIGERYESKLEPKIIGLGYEYQLTESSFGESHDMRYNKVITESNIHSFR